MQNEEIRNKIAYEIDYYPALRFPVPGPRYCLFISSISNTVPRLGRLWVLLFLFVPFLFHSLLIVFPSLILRRAGGLACKFLLFLFLHSRSREAQHPLPASSLKYVQTNSPLFFLGQSLIYARIERTKNYHHAR